MSVLQRSKLDSFQRPAQSCRGRAQINQEIPSGWLPPQHLRPEKALVHLIKQIKTIHQRVIQPDWINPLVPGAPQAPQNRLENAPGMLVPSEFQEFRYD